MNLTVQLLVTEIAYLYWNSDKAESAKRNAIRAQTVSLIYCANHFDKVDLWFNYHNDNIMSFFLVVAVYYLFTSRPWLASVFYTISLSIKAGSILLLPTLLGSIQLNFGTRTLLGAVVIIVAWQILVALPFVLGETSVADYLRMSKLTGQGRGGYLYAKEQYDHLATE